jgi:ATP-dependent DNA helicase RecG
MRRQPSQHIPRPARHPAAQAGERTVNVTVLPDVVTAPNGGQYIELRIPRAMAVASTTDGRYFLRVADQSKPVTGDDVMRLASERSALPWETQTTLHVPRAEIDAAKRDKLLQALRASDRVKPPSRKSPTTSCSITISSHKGRTSPTWACSASAASIIAPN